MPATATKTERPQALFDAAGNHLHVHGSTVRSSSANVLREMGVSPGLMVMTRAEPRRKKNPEVVLHLDDKPFNFDFRMAPAAARELATNLMQAADAADKVAVAMTATGVA
jgi:hypothetical protein